MRRPVRMRSPQSGTHPHAYVNGRVYLCLPGIERDVDADDALALAAQGWELVGEHLLAADELFALADRLNHLLIPYIGKLNG